MKALPVIPIGLFALGSFLFANPRGASGALLAAPGTAADPFPIHTVQLFSDQALVTRVGEARLVKGVNRIVIEDLAGTLIPDSVRVSLQTADEATARSNLRIQGIEVESDHRAVFLTSEAEEAERLLRQAESNLRTLSDRYRALQQEEQTLEKIQVGTVPPPENGTQGADRARDIRVDPATWRHTLNFVQEGLRKNHEQTQALLDRIDRARQELSVALFVADRYRSAKSLSRMRIRVEVQSPGEGRYRFRLAYRIPGAAWYPVYAARVASTGAAMSRSDQARVRLIAYALLRNETGEDWKGARLAFSAADPRESARLPRLASWRIEARLVADASASSTAGSGAGRSRKAYKEAPAQAANAAGEDMAFEEEAREPAAADDQQQTVVQSSNALPLQSKDRFRQERLTRQAERSEGYYSSNITQIQDQRAKKKSDETRKVLNEFQRNILQRDQALGRGDYDDALRYSDLVIDNIQNLDPRFQKHFVEEQRQSERVKRRSLEMQENRALVSRLIPPSKSARGYDHLYQARAPETVPSDGAFRKVYLYEKELTADLLYETAATSANGSQFAFLTGKVRYSEDSPLLSGPISIFHNRDYVGDAVLTDVSKREPFTVHLGANEDIQIQRRVERFREKSGILSTSYVYKNRVTIKVRNRKGTPVTLDVFDRIPVSSDERVKIAAIQMTPAPTEEKKEQGLLRFRLNLPGGGEQTITIQYNLIHPEDVLPEYREAGSPRW